ncbi:MAG: hypothetical protein ACLQVY_24525 [Limisphaerales bacterium]
MKFLRLVTRQSETVGTVRLPSEARGAKAGRAVRGCFLPAWSPRRGDPAFPRPPVIDVLLLAAFLAAGWAKAGDAATPPAIGTINPPQAGFYGRVLSMEGIPIKAHADVSDAAIFEAYRRLNRLLADLPQARDNLVSAGAEFHIIGKNQLMVDLPECQMWKGKKFDGDLTLDQRDRGWGGLMSSCGEENLLALPSDRYRDHRDICSHEFAHTLMAFGLSDDVVRRIKERYRSSTSKGLWPAYAGTNPDEFFAELTMWYFGSRGDYGKIAPSPQPGKAWLAAHDPEAFALLDDLYSGRIAITARVWKLLPLVDPDRISALRSGQSDRATILTARNLRASKCEVFWLDFSGKRVPYGEMQPFSVWSGHTYATHSWLFTDEHQQPLAAVVAEAEPGRIDLR